MRYFRMYLPNSQKTFFVWKMMKVAIVVENFKCTDILFRNSNATNFPISRKCKNFYFSLYTVPAEMLYLQKDFDEFSKAFFWLKDEEGGYCGWKFQLHRYFGFAIATLQIFQHPENVKISIFPFTLSQQKCYIFKSI